MTLASAGISRKMRTKELVRASRELSLASHDLLAHARELQDISTRLLGRLRAHRPSFLEIREKLGKKHPRPTNGLGWRA